MKTTTMPVTAGYPQPPSRFFSSVRVVPASVEVHDVDGVYHDSGQLREAASALLRAAERLDVLKARA